MEVVSARMALISEATVIMNPLSCGIPPSFRPPRPTTMLRSSRQFMSIAFLRKMRVGSMFSLFPLAMWFWRIADRRLCAAPTAWMSPVN